MTLAMETAQCPIEFDEVEIALETSFGMEL
jgi:hypothetical protein